MRTAAGQDTRRCRRSIFVWLRKAGDFGSHNACSQVASISPAEIETLGWFGKISAVSMIKKKHTHTQTTAKSTTASYKFKQQSRIIYKILNTRKNIITRWLKPHAPMIQGAKRCVQIAEFWAVLHHNICLELWPSLHSYICCRPRICALITHVSHAKMHTSKHAFTRHVGVCHPSLQSGGARRSRCRFTWLQNATRCGETWKNIVLFVSRQVGCKLRLRGLSNMAKKKNLNIDS